MDNKKKIGAPFGIFTLLVIIRFIASNIEEGDPEEKRYKENMTCYANLRGIDIWEDENKLIAQKLKKIKKNSKEYLNLTQQYNQQKNYIVDDKNRISECLIEVEEYEMNKNGKTVNSEKREKIKTWNEYKKLEKTND